MKKRENKSNFFKLFKLFNIITYLLDHHAMSAHTFLNFLGASAPHIIKYKVCFAELVAFLLRMVPFEGFFLFTIIPLYQYH